MMSLEVTLNFRCPVKINSSQHDLKERKMKLDFSQFPIKIYRSENDKNKFNFHNDHSKFCYISFLSDNAFESHHA